MKITGNLKILTAADAARYADVTEVGGDVYITAAGASLPLLAKVGGCLYIYAEGASLPALTSVGGCLYIYAEGVSLPALTSVGGSLYIRAEGASLPLLAEEHAFSTWSLRRHIKTGAWYAGCRGPWTTEEALAHWGKRDDERARLFTAAILKAEK